MAPVARVVVYYVRPDGEVVADALNFDVEGTFQNFVSSFPQKKKWNYRTLASFIWIGRWK